MKCYKWSFLAAESEQGVGTVGGHLSPILLAPTVLQTEFDRRAIRRTRQKWR